MDIQVTSTHLQQNLNSVLDQIERGGLVCAVERAGHEKVVMLPESEYNSIMETLHLMSSSRNHKALIESYKQAEDGKLHSFDMVSGDFTS